MPALRTQLFCIFFLCFASTAAVAQSEDPAVPAESDKAPAAATQTSVPPAAPAEAAPAALSLPQARVAIAEALWQKANSWLGGRHKEAGRLLMEDLSRDFPDTVYGRQAALWIFDNRGLNQDGRTKLIIGSTLQAALLGFSVSTDLTKDSGDSGKTIAWTTLGSALVGLGASAYISSRINVSDSQATLFGFAGAWGYYNGFLVYALVNDIGNQDVVLAAAGGQTAALALSAGLWDRLDVDEGAAQFSIWSGIYALEVSALLDFAIGGKDVFQNHRTAAQLGLLIPSNAAVVAGYLVGNKLRWTADDINLIGLGGFLGNLLGGALVASFDGLQDARKGTLTLTGCVLGSLALSTAILRPWQRAGATSEASPTTTALLNFDWKGVRLGVPAPGFMPVEHAGRTGIGLQVPILSFDL